MCSSQKKRNKIIWFISKYVYIFRWYLFVDAVICLRGVFKSPVWDFYICYSRHLWYWYFTWMGWATIPCGVWTIWYTVLPDTIWGCWVGWVWRTTLPPTTVGVATTAAVPTADGDCCCCCGCCKFNPVLKLSPFCGAVNREARIMLRSDWYSVNIFTLTGIKLNHFKVLVAEKGLNT